MRIGPVIDKLDGLKAFRQVDGALAMADLRQALKSAPAAFVIPTAERAGENRLAGAHDQKIDVGFTVVVAIAAAARAADSVPESLHELTAAVRDALTGWTHPDMSSATEYGGGQIINLTGGYLFWRLDFRARYHFRKV